MANPALLISMPGGAEWIIILIVVILVFGGRKIPELMRGLGKGMKEFKDAKDGDGNADKSSSEKKPDN